jgi:hypothetical protein
LKEAETKGPNDVELLYYLDQAMSAAMRAVNQGARNTPKIGSEP